MKTMHTTKYEWEKMEDEKRQNDKNDKYKWNKHFHM